MRAGSALDVLLKKQPDSVLSVGETYDGQHATVMRQSNIEVTTIDMQSPADYVGDYMAVDFTPQETIWCSHVLEHQRNPGHFLDKMYQELTTGGWLFLTVPPQKSKLAGGHVTIWNGTVLIYQLILAGFDCREADVWRYGYNISCVVQKTEPPMLEDLVYDKPDKPKIAKYFPQDFSEKWA